MMKLRLFAWLAVSSAATSFGACSERTRDAASPDAGSANLHPSDVTATDTRDAASDTADEDSAPGSGPNPAPVFQEPSSPDATTPSGPEASTVTSEPGSDPPFTDDDDAGEPQGGAGGVTSDETSTPGPTQGGNGGSSGFNGAAGTGHSGGGVDASVSAPVSTDAAPPAASVGQPGQVLCGAEQCTLVDNSLCCFTMEAEGYCSDQGVCLGNDGIFQCDEASDCSDGMCCFEGQANGTDRATCGGACPAEQSATILRVQLCAPDSDECQSGSCQPTTLDGRLPAGFFACL